MVQIKNVDFVETVVICCIKSFWFFLSIPKIKVRFWKIFLISLHWNENFEMRISSQFTEVRIMNWESHLTSSEVRFRNENFFSHFGKEILRWDSHFKISLASKWENNYKRNIILDIPDIPFFIGPLRTNFSNLDIFLVVDMWNVHI